MSVEDQDRRYMENVERVVAAAPGNPYRDELVALLRHFLPRPHDDPNGLVCDLLIQSIEDADRVAVEDVATAVGPRSAIRARADAATPGPWRLPEEVGDAYKAPALVTEPVTYSDGHTETVSEPVLDHEGCSVWPWKRPEDMEFAYRAREDIPWLLAEIDRLLVQDAAAAESPDDHICPRCGTRTDDPNDPTRAQVDS